MDKKHFCQACSNLIHGVKTRKSISHTCSKEQKARTLDLVNTTKIIESGYAGVLSNGNIVDRREHPEATPIQENSLFNTPKPKKI
jgi:hypothetical protein